MKTVLAVVLPLVVLGVFLASFWYVAYRFRTFFGLERRWPLRIGIAVTVFASMVPMFAAAKSASAVVGLLDIVGGYLFSYFVFVTLLLLVLHPLERRMKLVSKGRLGGLVLVIAFLVTATGALWANRFGVAETTIPLPGLERPVVLVQLSDVHLGHQRGRAYLEELVAEANRRRPDIVLISGDLVDANAALLPGELTPLAALEAPAYFVGGNHDSYVDTERALALIAAQGVRILHNEVVETHGVQLIGLDYMNPDENTFDMHPSEDSRTIESVLPTLSITDALPSVLMHHSPVGARYVAAKGVDLMVAGHTHGGQMFPGSLFAPWIFEYNTGLYERGELRIYVSQGAGTFGPRMRLGTSNEIDLLRLVPAER